MAKKVQGKSKKGGPASAGICACGGNLQYAKLGVGWKSMLLCDKCGEILPKEMR